MLCSGNIAFARPRWIIFCNLCVASAHRSCIAAAVPGSDTVETMHPFQMTVVTITSMDIRDFVESSLTWNNGRYSSRTLASRRPKEDSTCYLPKRSLPGLLGNLLLPTFLPIAHLHPFATPAIDRHYQRIMHAKPLPREPRAMKQALAGLVRASFLIKHGQRSLRQVIRVD